MEILNLSVNKIRDLPFYFYRLNALEVLLLSRNKFYSFPSVLTDLTNLRKLDISSNKISSITFFIYRLNNLEELDISSNKLYSLPKEIKKLKNLKKLTLYGNDIPWEVEKSFRIRN